jgi:hypothetical protein
MDCPICKMSSGHRCGCPYSYSSDVSSFKFRAAREALWYGRACQTLGIHPQEQPSLVLYVDAVNLGLQMGKEDWVRDESLKVRQGTRSCFVEINPTEWRNDACCSTSDLETIRPVS